MAQYRISWYGEVEDGSVLEGRSLVRAENVEEAVKELIIKKCQEFRLQPQNIFIQSVIPLHEQI